MKTGKFLATGFQRLEFYRWEKSLLAAAGALACLALLLLGLLAVLPKTPVTTFDGEWSAKPEEIFESTAAEAICEAFDLGGTLTISIEALWVVSGRYPNLFQTADGNSGVRFELGPSGDAAALLIAARTADGFEYFPLTKDDTDNLSVVYTIRDGTEVQTFSGGTVLVSESPLMNPECSRFMVGVGYDASRTWAANANLSITASRNSAWGIPLALQSSSTRALMVLVSVLFGSFFVLSIGFAIVFGINRSPTSAENVSPDLSVGDSSESTEHGV